MRIQVCKFGAASSIHQVGRIPCVGELVVFRGDPDTGDIGRVQSVFHILDAAPENEFCAVVNVQ